VQNSRDRVLVPLIADVAARANVAIGSHFGKKLPRPLRIELVADQFSLSAVTGLPLEAAETTGTIAIARWGKVTLVSPRATPDGYPWQDTLAHEIAHLVVSMQSADMAPLWLQEGLAKREETAWRASTPFDTPEDFHRTAQRALASGQSVGIDRLGPSIALLPTPNAAEIAYAEARDFIEYFTRQSGRGAIRLLLQELRTLGREDIDRSLLTVSGYTLTQWIVRWQHALLNEDSSGLPRQPRAPAVAHEATEPNASEPGADAAWRLRLAQLTEERRHFDVAADYLSSYAALPVMPVELARHAAFANLQRGQSDAARSFVSPISRVSHVDGAWLAMRGRALQSQDPEAAEIAFAHSLAFAPTLEKAACRGFLAVDVPSTVISVGEPWSSLCRSARPTFLENPPKTEAELGAQEPTRRPSGVSVWRD
jgi:hypothetical protein